MKNFKKHFAAILGVCLSAAMLLAGCGNTGNGNNSEDSTNDNTLSTEYITETEIQSVIKKTVSAPDLTGAKTVTLTDDGVTIDAGGVYVLSGATTGRITVNAKDAEVTLVLNGITVNCADSSALYVYKAKSVTLWLAEGTQNMLTDAATYSFSDALSSKEDEEPNACVYSKADMVIAGTGTLTVNGSASNGITGKDTLCVETATVRVTAKNHGINGKDALVVKSAAVTVDCGGDALRSTNDSDKKCGFVALSDVTLSLTAGEDGVQAETVLFADSGTVTVKTGGGSTATVSSDTSAKGLKAGAGVLLKGGSYALDCSDDAIHSNGNAAISDGTFVLATGDDGVHADENVTVSGGTITVTKSYEGIEGATVDITGGVIDITASDDGLNAAGGNDQSGFGPRMDNFGGGRGNDSTYYIRIAGGKITINAGGDGIDSNGSLTVSGGETYVSGPPDKGNGALDFDGTGTITGGIVVAAGASGMAQNFSENSTQGSMLVSFGNFGTGAVTVTNAAGETLVSFTPVGQYSCVVVSAPTLQKGETYTVNACGQSQSVTLSSLIYGGGMGGSFGGAGNQRGQGRQQNGKNDGGTPPSKPDSGSKNGRKTADAATAATGSVLKRYKKQRSLFEAALFLQCIIGAKSAPMKAARTVGSISICKPILPPLTKMAGSDFAVSSMTVKNGFFMPTGLHPPRI